MVLEESYLCVALILDALLLAFGWSGQQKGDGQPMSSLQTAQRDNCSLDVESRIDGQRSLRVRYTFHNDTGKDVYLFNRLYREIEHGPVFGTDPNLLNVESVPRFQEESC